MESTHTHRDKELREKHLDVEGNHAAVHLLSVEGRQHSHNSAAGVDVEVALILVWRH